MKSTLHNDRAPILDADLDGIVAIDDDGNVDAEETERLRQVIAIAGKRDAE
jgi:hypothetical protein